MQDSVPFVISVDKNKAYAFFLEVLSEKIRTGKRTDDELKHVASVLAHFSITSTG